MTGASPVAAPDRDDSSWPSLLLVPLVIFWTVRLLLSPDRGCFLDWVNLAFHEAGHIALTPFGSTLHYLGGMLGQTAVPILLAVYFLRRVPALPLGAAACAWWTGENFINISIYMADARDLALPLVGGGDHDWNELFYRFGLLGEESVRTVSGVTRAGGILLMVAGLGWTATLMMRGCCWRRPRFSALASRSAALPPPPAPSS